MVEVSEEGSKASATKLSKGNIYPQPRIIHVNNPFRFFIKHIPSNMFLAMGRIMCPDPGRCRNISSSDLRPDGTSDAATNRTQCQGLACEDEVSTQPGAETDGTWMTTATKYSRASIPESGSHWNMLPILWPISYVAYTVHN